MPRLAAMHLSVLKIPCGGLFARDSGGSGSSVLCSCLSPSLDIRAPLTATAGRPPQPWQGFHRLRATSAWRDRAWLPLPAPLGRTPVRAAPCWPPRGPVLARRGATLCLPPPSGPSRDQNPQRPRSALDATTAAPARWPLVSRPHVRCGILAVSLLRALPSGGPLADATLAQFLGRFRPHPLGKYRLACATLESYRIVVPLPHRFALINYPPSTFIASRLGWWTFGRICSPAGSAATVCHDVLRTDCRASPGQPCTVPYAQKSCTRA